MVKKAAADQVTRLLPSPGRRPSCVIAPGHASPWSRLTCSGPIWCPAHQAPAAISNDKEERRATNVHGAKDPHPCHRTIGFRALAITLPQPVSRAENFQKAPSPTTPSSAPSQSRRSCPGSSRAAFLNPSVNPNGTCGRRLSRICAAVRICRRGTFIPPVS
jgi:hypothetical protein